MVFLNRTTKLRPTRTRVDQHLAHIETEGLPRFGPEDRLRSPAVRALWDDLRISRGYIYDRRRSATGGPIIALFPPGPGSPHPRPFRKKLSDRPTSRTTSTSSNDRVRQSATCSSGSTSYTPPGVHQLGRCPRLLRISQRPSQRYGLPPRTSMMMERSGGGPYGEPTGLGGRIWGRCRALRSPSPSDAYGIAFQGVGVAARSGPRHHVPLQRLRQLSSVVAGASGTAALALGGLALAYSEDDLVLTGLRND